MNSIISAVPKPKLVRPNNWDVVLAGVTVMLVSESIGCPVPRTSKLSSVTLDSKIW